MDSSDEADLLQSNLSTLSTGISSAVGEFADKVFEKKLITMQNCRAAHIPQEDAYERSSALLMILLDRIKTTPQEFHLILDILKSMPTMKELVKILQPSHSALATVSG